MWMQQDPPSTHTGIQQQAGTCTAERGAQQQALQPRAALHGSAGLGKSNGQWLGKHWGTD